MDTSVADTGHLLTQIGRVSDAVKVEFDLIGTRMTWLVVSQSFMFATFATAAANAGSKAGPYLPVLKYLVIATPLLGVAVAAFVALAIKTAHAVAIDMKNQRDTLILQLPEALRIRLVSSRDHAHSRGNLPAKWVPWLLTAFWVGAIVSLPFPP